MLVLFMLILSLMSEAAWYKLLSGVCKPVTVSDNRIILSANNRINNVTEKKKSYRLLHGFHY